MANRLREKPLSDPGAARDPLKTGLHRGLVGALLVLVVLTPLYFTTSLSDYNTPKLALVQILTTLACALWFTGMAVEGRVYLIKSPIYYALLAFMAANFISLFQAYNQPQGLETMFQYLCHFLLCVVVFNTVKDEGEGRAILWAAVGTASAISVIGLLQYHHIYDFHSEWGLPISTLGNVTYVAEYLDIALPVAVALALGGKGLGRYAAGGAAFLMLCLIVVLGSRGGWVGVMVSAVVFVGAWGWRHFVTGHRLPGGRKFALAAAIALVLVGVIPRLPAGKGVTVGKVLGDRWTAIFQRSEAAVRVQDQSSRQRVLIWKDTLSLIRDRPLLGVGVGNFAYNLPKYASRESAENLARMRTAVGMDLAAYQAHNGYLEVMAETGFLGLAAFLWMFYAVCGMFYRLLGRYAHGETDVLSVGLVAAAAATLVHALFSLNFQNPASASHFWIVTGLAAALERKASGLEERIPLLETRSGSSVLPVVGICVAALFVAGVVSTNAVTADYYYNEGRYDWKANPKRLERARFNFERSVAYRPYSFGAYQMLGNVFNELRLWDEAEAAYRKSLRCHPNNRMVHKLLGEVLMRSGRYEEAAEVFRAAIRLDPVFAEAYYRLGYCERQVGRYDEAIRAHVEALALEPQNVEFMNSLGAARIAQGDYRAAIADLSRAEAANPNHAGVQTNLGIACFSLSRTQEALDHYQRAVALDPKQPNAYVLIGQVYQEQLKDLAKAREYYEKALVLSPQDARIAALVRGL